MHLKTSSIIGLRDPRDSICHNHPTEGVGGMFCWVFIQIHPLNVPRDKNANSTTQMTQLLQGVKQNVKLEEPLPPEVRLVHVSRTSKMNVSTQRQAQKHTAANAHQFQTFA